MGQPSGIWAYNRLRTKHFHGISSGNQHLYLLKSRYGKASYLFLALFSIVLSLAIALTLPNYILKHQQITSSHAASSGAGLTGAVSTPPANAVVVPAGSSIQNAVNSN